VAVDIKPGQVLAARLRTEYKRVYLVDTYVGEPKLYPNRTFPLQEFLALRKRRAIELVREDDIRLVEYWRVL